MDNIRYLPTPQNFRYPEEPALPSRKSNFLVRSALLSGMTVAAAIAISAVLLIAMTAIVLGLTREALQFIFLPSSDHSFEDPY